MGEYPYYEFDQDHYEGRYWNNDGKNIAIVARVTPGIDWAAYIGAEAQSSDEQSALDYVAKYGCKLSEGDARYFFPEVKLPYRG